MRTILTLLVVFMLAGTVAWADDQYDFRNTKWGMSKEEVKQSESATLFKEEKGRIGYTDKVIGLDALIIYNFTGGSLSSSEYRFTSQYTNKNNYYYNIFNPMVDMLEKKYGKPISRQKVWYNNLYKGNPSEIGMALATGGLGEYAMWQTDTSFVLAHINGENYKISTGVEYKSKKFEEAEKMHKEKKELKKF